VLDTGIDQSHPDLTRVTSGKSFVAGESMQDLHGHGTHCAGVLTGSMPGSGRIPYGVAPDADLLVAKVLDKHGVGWDNDIIDAIDWAADLGADVVSLSLGSPRQMGESYPLLYETVASGLRAQLVIVAAAGNESLAPNVLEPVGSIASCPSILSVGAIDQRQLVAPFSCRQLDPVGKLDLCGPGVGVYSAWLKRGHKSLSGTSMATPHVAGLAALLAERGGNSLRGDVLRKQLLASAKPIGQRRDYGNGLPVL
jgi:subtilisin family serine protease